LVNAKNGMVHEITKPRKKKKKGLGVMSTVSADQGGGFRKGVKAIYEQKPAAA